MFCLLQNDTFRLPMATHLPADRISNHAGSAIVDDDLEKEQTRDTVREHGIFTAALQGKVTTELTHFERRAALINE